MIGEKQIRKALTPSLPKQVEAMRQRCLKAVADEEELEGDMPYEVWELLKPVKDDRQAMTKVVRAIVRDTKAGISERIKKL
jgi:hypothetical protein